MYRYRYAYTYIYIYIYMYVYLYVRPFIVVLLWAVTRTAWGAVPKVISLSSTSEVLELFFERLTRSMEIQEVGKCPDPVWGFGFRV